MHLERSEAVATLVFDNRQRHNAMTVAMWKQVAEHCRTVDADSSIRLVVLTGAGSEAFVAGADISEFGEHRTPESAPSYDVLTAEAQSAIRALAVPVVAKIKGFCIGGGLALALAADLRFCDDTAVFGLPPARLGIGYSPNGVGGLVDVVGPGPAAELLYGASWIKAPRAERWGLVNEVVPVDDFDQFTDKWVSTAVSRAPLSQQAAKLAIRAHLARGTEQEGLDERAQALVQRCYGSEDYMEGIAAFGDKRSPMFKGR